MDDRRAGRVSAQENERLTRVGPDTPMGALLRRYWHPIAPADEIGRRPTLSVRVLGENLVLFRSADGRLGLVGDRCPHRGTALVFGMPEAGGLRCAYHGWLIDRRGACIEMPAEQPGSAERRGLGVAGYPVAELGGLVFAYLGPGTPPLLPRWPNLVAQGAPREIAYVDVPCNWLQIMENSVDQVHYEWLHLRFSAFAGKQRAEPTVEMGDRHLEGDYLETEYGFIKRFRLSSDSDQWRLNGPFVFPTLVVTGPAQMPCFHLRVPLDDQTTRQYFHTVYHLPPALRARLAQTDLDPVVLDGSKVQSYRLQLPRLEEPHYEELAGNVFQDIAVVVAQGAIYDRSTENPGRSDKGITLLRNLLRRELTKVQRGEDPINVFRDPEKNAALTLPGSDMASLQRYDLYPKQGRRPSGNVQAFSPFLNSVAALGIDLCELLAGPPPP